MSDKKEAFVYTEEQLMARLKFFIGVCLALTLTGIVFVVLYSLIFVTQPLNAISPIDQKFFELIVPIATFLTGTLSGIMLAGGKKEDQDAMIAAQKQAQESFKTTIEAVKAPAADTNKTPAFGPAPMMSSGMNNPFGGSTTNMMPTNAQLGTPAPGFGGKLAPPQAPQPEI